MSAADTSMPTQATPPSGGDGGQPASNSPASPTGGSRLAAILGAVAHTASVGIAGAANQKGRASFTGGLVGGANAELQDQANQQNLKFRTFQDSVRAAQLHNEDVRMQNANEDHQAAVQARAESESKRMTETTGMTYTFVPNDDGGKSALDHMGVQMAQNGHVEVPAGTIAGPKGWYIPNKGSDEQAQANTKDFNMKAPFYGFGSVPNGKVVQGSAYDQLRQASNGLDNQGHPMHANDLQGRVDNMTEQLAKYKERPDADPDTIKAVQSDIDHLTNLQGITKKREDTAIGEATQRKTEQQKDIINAQTEQKKEIVDEKAKVTPPKAGSDEWRAGATTMQKNKADLAENIAMNSNSVASILLRRPDLVGAVAGRFTTGKQMMGNNDKDISALGTAIHNIGMANNGIHGMKSAEEVEKFEKLVLNNFKNGPQAVGGALHESTKSIQTFIDAARPDTYKTHSKNGGAVKAMVSQ